MRAVLTLAALALALAAPAHAEDCYVDAPAVVKPRPKAKPRPKVAQVVPEGPPKPRPVAKPRPKVAKPTTPPQRIRVDCPPAGGVPARPGDAVVADVPVSSAPRTSLVEAVGIGLRTDSLVGFYTGAPGETAPIGPGLPPGGGFFPPQVIPPGYPPGGAAWTSRAAGTSRTAGATGATGTSGTSGTAWTPGPAVAAGPT